MSTKAPPPTAARRVLVTGPGGYVGSAIVLDLARRGLEVCGYGHGRLFDALQARGFETLRLVEGELDDGAGIARALQGVGAIVHTASFAGERACQRDKPGALRTIVRGTRILVDAARAAGITRFVHLSTYAVYSTFAERLLPLAEIDPLLPDDLYGTLKAEAEWEASRIGAAILRLTNVFGRGSGLVTKTDVMGHFLRAVESGGPIKTQGGGRQGIEFVHIDDVCRVVANLLGVEGEIPAWPSPSTATNPAPLVVNIGAGHATSVRSVAELFQEIARIELGRPVPITDEPAPADKTWPDRWTSIGRAQTLWPWYPAQSLENGIRELVLGLGVEAKT